MPDPTAPPSPPDTPVPNETVAMQPADAAAIVSTNEPPAAVPSPIARPSVPSPSTVPEPELPEPSAAASFGVILLMIGMTSAIVIVIAAIIAAGVFITRSYLRPRHDAQQTPTAIRPALPPFAAPPPAVPTIVTPLVTAPPTAPPTAAEVPAPAPVAPAEHGPFIASMSPATGNVDEPITLRGRGLGQVEDIILFPQHGGASVETAVQSTDDRSATFSVPAVEKPEGYQPGDGYYVGVFSKTGACLLVDSTFRSTTPTDPAGTSHEAVRVRFNSPLDGGDHLLVFGDTGSTVSVGTDCVVLLRSNCLLKSYGGGCKIFYMPPLRGTVLDADGLIPMTDIRLSTKGPRLMLKLLGDPGAPPDPNK